MIAPPFAPVRARWRLTLLLLCSLMSGCDDARVVACFGDQEFCRKVITANLPPTAAAGADQEVTAGATVTLDGSGSTDPDGRIASFSWTQQSGTPVTLQDAGQAAATFAAPDVAARETLTFRLTVVDDRQAASEDDVSVVVQPVPVLTALLGFAVLSRSVAPEPVLTPAPCTVAPRLQGAAWFAQAGLWLSAHVAALDPDADPEAVTRFLDAARVLLARADEDPGSRVAGEIWLAGLDDLYRYALDRDPALSAWARSRLAAAPVLAEHPKWEEITLLVAQGEPRVIPRNPATATADAVASVRGSSCRSGLDPLRLSADTLYLLGRGSDASGTPGPSAPLQSRR